MARKEKIFKIDDVFVTGILAKEAGGIQHRLECSIDNINNSLHLDLRRSIASMVGISIGPSNAYSMLTGSFR